MKFILQHTRYLSIALVVVVGHVIALKDAFGATQAETPRSMTVSYSDLDLASSIGIDTLYRRIQEAARKVCKIHDPYLRLYIRDRRAVRKCNRLTVADTVAELNIQMLSARHHATR